MYMKPHWGGGWRDVHRVTRSQRALGRYNQTGHPPMILQEEIAGPSTSAASSSDGSTCGPPCGTRARATSSATPRPSSMPPLSPELEKRVISDARKLCQALGYDMNTVELAIRDGVPYAIDFMNSAPDFDISSLGEAHFTWTVGRMADVLVKAAREPRLSRPPAGNR